MIQHHTLNPFDQDVMLFVAGTDHAINCACCDANVSRKRDVNRYECKRCANTYKATPHPDAPPPVRIEAPNV